VSAFRAADLSPEEGLRGLWPACHCAGLVWDFDSRQVLSDRLVKLARDAGAVTLPGAVNMRATVHLFAGEFTAAASLIAQVESVSQAIGISVPRYAALALAVFRGREAEAAELIATATKDAERRGEGAWPPFVQWATAILCNSLGQYEKAQAAAQQGSQADSAGGLHMTVNWATVELIEAAVRSGMPERAAGALQRLAQATRASGTDWARGIEARSRALVSDGEAAEACYREAIDYLGRTPLRVDLGRAHLLYGEWLRRQRRIRDARDQLRRAHTLFAGFGMEAFAERARFELRATGARTLRRTAGTPDVLTAQEALIARLASAGASNQEIAAQLFISPATAAYHLSKVFAKLGISSRSQLARALPAQPDAGPAAAPQGQGAAPAEPRDRTT
jgi:DNA-binding CsgD family transcriptional regulator